MERKKDKCYMCNEYASSREHVPPKCIFPETKDISDQNFREELITVPSCDIHNLKKSQDDEFLLVSLAGIIGNNSIGYMHKFTKVDRSIKRSAGKLISKVFLKKDIYNFEIEENKFIEIIWGTPDYDRLEKCFTHIAYGVFYHHFKKRFKGSVKILLGYLYAKEKNPNNFKNMIKHKVDIELKNKKIYGKNRKIFFYQFTEKDKYGLFLLKLVFYGGIDVYISFIPEGVNLQKNLGIELMNSGIKTFIKIEDKIYEFN